MAYETGTASNYRDLLDKLRLFLTTNASLVADGQEWTQMRWVTTSNTQELILKGPGLAGLDEIYVGISSDENTSSDWFNWHMNGYGGFDNAQTFFTQPGSFSYLVSQLYCLNLWNSSTPYWFVANGRRFIVVARVNTYYFIAYMGLGVPYATPEQYPYPNILLGNAQSYYNSRWSAVPNGRSVAVFRGAVWQYASKWPSSFQLRPTEDPVYQLLPIVLYDTMNLSTAQSRYLGKIYCELDGVFACSGYNNVSENLIQIGGVDYLVVQDGSSTGISDYWAVRLS